MDSLQDLDDPAQTVIYLPPRDDIEDEDERRDGQPTAGPFLSSSPDIPEGYEIRMKAYKKAWSKCLERVQSIVRELHTPVVSSVVSHIRSAYDEAQIVPGLPYPEIPVVGISLPGGSSMLNEVLTELTNTPKPSHSNGVNKGKGRMVDDSDEAMDVDASPKSSQTRDKFFAVHLSPAECPNLVSAMKAIVSGFVDRPQVDEDMEDEDGAPLQGPKRKATASLANYDINLLEAWYITIAGQSDNRPRLLVVLHDFDQFNSSVLQDVFAICSQHIATLPIIFLLAFATPSAASYLRAAYSRSTLALLRVWTTSAPEVLENVLVKTFFDPSFEPDVMIGPATVDYIVEFGTRHTPAIDTMLTILQLVHMKHFEQPLSVFVYNNLLGTSHLQEACAKLEEPTSFAFLDRVLSRLWSDASDQTALDDVRIDSQSPTIEDLLETVDAARTQARKVALNTRIGFQVLYLVRKFMLAQGYSTKTSGPNENIFTVISHVVRGIYKNDAKYLALLIKNLDRNKMDELLAMLYGFFNSLPALRRQEEDARMLITTAINEFPTDQGDDGRDQDDIQEGVRAIGVKMQEWFTTYIDLRLNRLDSGPLWDVWNTGTTPFPSELLNPAPRLTIINALLHPYQVISTHKTLFKLDSGSTSDHPEPELDDAGGSVDEEERQYALWELPDTSILFRRYMDSGRMINVYDWYQSFAVALETQRDQLRDRRTRTRTPSPKKTRAMGKGKQKAVKEDEDMELDEEDGMTEDEKWGVEVQARFMRALHELDFMGFVKHTGRKADHVIKTIYDIPD